MTSTAIDLEGFQDAVHEWFHQETGLRTVWRTQTAPQIPYPFGSLKMIAGPSPLNDFAEERQGTDDLSRPLGEEIELNTYVPCTVTISCQAFVGVPDARNPGWNAYRYLLEAMSSLFSNSVCDTLRYKGITVLEVAELQNLDEVIEDSSVSRANLDVRFGIVLTRTEYTGFIETVHIKSESLGVDRDFGVIE